MSALAPTLADVSVDTVISTAGLLFAAIAAWSSCRTVQLTWELQREADLRSLLEALVSIKHSAGAIVEAPVGTTRPELEDRFRDAQAQLDRSLRMGVTIRGTSAANTDELEDILVALRTAEPRRTDLLMAIVNTEHALTLLTTQPPPPLMPKWWRRLIYRLSKRRPE